MRLLLSDEASARGALGITSFLKSFYEERQPYRVVVQAVVARLRDAGALNKHGYGHSVGQAMKTASTALLCASLQVTDPSLSTETDVLRALAAFDSTRWVVILRVASGAEVGTELAARNTAGEAWTIQQKRWCCYWQQAALILLFEGSTDGSQAVGDLDQLLPVLPQGLAQRR